MTNRRLAYIVREQDPLALPSTASVKQACQRMCERRVGAVLVTGTDGRLVGIFTGRDAVRCLGDGLSATRTRLADVMTKSPCTIAPERTAIDALRTMQDGGYRHLPIVADDRILGVVSRGDFKGLELDRLEGETLLWERMS